MRRPAKSVCLFGIFVAALSVAMLAVPNILLGLFGVPPTSEVRTRVAGIGPVLIAFYYIQAARHEMTEFFRWTVYARASVILFFSLFVLLGLAPAALILFGVIDLLGASWTAAALRPAANPVPQPVEHW